MSPDVVPALYPSLVTHVRTRPERYVLTHRTYLWLVDLDRLPVLPRPLRALARFEGRDHFAGRPDGIRAGLERFLAAHGVDLAGGRVLMLANARVLGHVFNPLTLFWCYGPGGEPCRVVAEVHNTYGERHAYLLEPDGAGRAEVAKEFYVSPFFPVDGAYRMRLPVPDERLRIAVELTRDGDSVFTATVRGERRPATARNLLRALARHPWPTLAVSAAIRRHGIRLWLRGLPVQDRPDHRVQKGMQ
ncbi:Hypothetical protein KY5_6516 [Streptomyces formicae]|uniref:DUF1365 domain-containing protein n=1 Tax=Streptomyces formicae TaxID=1616117 RepID=A0A291QJ72_9ACTN|nr:DUF1365 domain-containing protein [Streptomyces formicae]ATL31534.1 Hypothetical protein KY5_6516 [Streptomyces formicae]